MPLRGSSGYYSDVSWFVRAARAVPVIAGAALLGGLIGGFAVFAVDSALNWEPASRPEARADNRASVPTAGQPGMQPSAQSTGEANAVEQHPTKPVRVVGGAIPDPSAGMSGPPPAAQPQRSSTAAQPQNSSQPNASQPNPSQPTSPQPVSSQLLAPKPLGPATQLQPSTATASTVIQTRNQPVSQTNQSSVSTQNTTPAQEQRWPDALSRAHQNASNTQEQSAQPPAPQSSGANKNAEVDRKAADSNHAATVDNQERPSSARYSRHSRRQQPVFSSNGGSYANDNATLSRRQPAFSSKGGGYANDDGTAAPSRRQPASSSKGRGYATDEAAAPSQRQDARAYDRDRLYDSYRDRRLSPRAGRREQPYGDAYDAPPQPRPEPFWGGGFFGRGRDYYSDDY